LPITLDRKTRDALIEDHLDHVRVLVRRVQRDIGGTLDSDELYAFGTEGLVEAAGRYDPSRGVTFKTFSYYRIRGAIFDGLRQQGWLSRNAYARYQSAQNDLLENNAERQAPSAGKLDPAQAVTEVADTLDQLATVFVTSLDAMEQTDIPDTDAQPSDDAVGEKQMQRQVRQAVNRLPERERRLIELYYFRGLTLQEAGSQLGSSKSWSSRIHARAIRLLTSALRDTLAA